MPGFGANVYETIRKVTKPTIAMVRGWCIGLDTAASSGERGRDDPMTP